jgi:hypothetical protein
MAGPGPSQLEDKAARQPGTGDLGRAQLISAELELADKPLIHLRKGLPLRRDGPDERSPVQDHVVGEPNAEGVP